MMEDFEELYRREAEPWSYSSRGAEALRHEAVSTIAGRLIQQARVGQASRILDVGCAAGQLTSRLAGSASEIHGLDISPTAVLKARDRCAGLGGSQFRFLAGTSTAPPYRPGSFDLLLLCDGLHSWHLTPQQQDETLNQLHRMARPGAHVILTDYLKTAHFEPFIARIRHSPLNIVEIRYLNDRLWYTIERLLRPVRQRMSVKRILASQRVGRALGAVSRLAGRHGSKHLMVIARRGL
jgi:ubiquinone/menaquinone biosynthesis C-methylase UbiE